MAPFRLGLDTGGTFTDVVAFDESTGGVFTTKTPSTPADPSIGFMAGVRKVAELAQVATHRREQRLARHYRRHQRAAGRRGIVPGSGADRHAGLPPHPRNRPAERAAGLRQLVFLGEARAHRAAASRPGGRPSGSTFRAACSRRWTRRTRAAPPHGSATAIACIGVCFLHAYARADHEQRMRDIFSAIYPDASVSISCEVCPSTASTSVPSRPWSTRT